MKIIKYSLYTLLATLVMVVLFVVNTLYKPFDNARIQLALNEKPKTLEADGIKYVDLNKNGRFDVYENSRASTADRVEDLLSQMTLEEKVGQMMHPAITIEPNADLLVFHAAMGRSGLEEVDIIIDKVSDGQNKHKEYPIQIRDKG